jgi:hypothetical protein
MIVSVASLIWTNLGLAWILLYLAFDDLSKLFMVFLNLLELCYSNLAVELLDRWCDICDNLPLEIEVLGFLLLFVILNGGKTTKGRSHGCIISGVGLLGIFKSNQANLLLRIINFFCTNLVQTRPACVWSLHYCTIIPYIS